MKAHRNQGATLLEIIVALAIAGILAAIAIPRLLDFLQKQLLTQATNQVYQILRSVRSLAVKNSVNYVVEFSDYTVKAAQTPVVPSNGFTYYPVRTTIATARRTAVWSKLPQGVDISYLNCASVITGGNKGVQFDSRGNVITTGMAGGGLGNCSIYLQLGNYVAGGGARPTSSLSDSVIDPSSSSDGITRAYGESLKAVIISNLIGKARVVQ